MKRSLNALSDQASPYFPCTRSSAVYHSLSHLTIASSIETSDEPSVKMHERFFSVAYVSLVTIVFPRKPIESSRRDERNRKAASRSLTDGRDAAVRKIWLESTRLFSANASIARSIDREAGESARGIRFPEKKRALRVCNRNLRIAAS